MRWLCITMSGGLLREAEMRMASRVPFAVTLAAAVLSGCNLPSRVEATAAAQTAAALTVEAELTAASPATTATSTMAAFPTLPSMTAAVATTAPATTPTSDCDVADFVADVTYPDGAAVDAGQSFTKTWRLKNTGTCSWTPSYAVVFTSGELMGGPAVQSLLGNVNPGQTVDLSVALTAPADNGSHTGKWGLRNAAGVIFSRFYVQVLVGGGTGGEFAVTHVTFSLSTSDDGLYHDCPTVTAQITTSAAGDVKFHWTRSDGVNSAVMTRHFDAAGSQDVDNVWQLPTAAGSATRWLGIYVDEPNHQNFGHQEFTSTCSSP